MNDKQQDEAEQERGRRQKNACYSFMLQDQEASQYGISHEDYMKWSFGDADAMTPDARAIMEAHERASEAEKANTRANIISKDVLQAGGFETFKAKVLSPAWKAIKWVYDNLLI